MSDDLVGPAEVRAAIDYVVTTLEPAATEEQDQRWDQPAGGLRWTCRATLAHIVDCQLWYAALLSRRSDGEVDVPEADPAASAKVLLDQLRSTGALLAAVVTTAAPEDRAWHPFGVGDRSGFAAMGCDEALVHGSDIAAGLDLRFAPPPDVCGRVTRRLFPAAPADAPADADPWHLLLWANGRRDLPDLPTSRRWAFHTAPLSD